jgi:hypothetical protein
MWKLWATRGHLLDLRVRDELAVLISLDLVSVGDLMAGKKQEATGTRKEEDPTSRGEERIWRRTKQLRS